MKLQPFLTDYLVISSFFYLIRMKLMANWFSTETMFVLVLLSCMRLSCELFDSSVSGFITVLLSITDIISTPSIGSKILISFL